MLDSGAWGQSDDRRPALAGEAPLPWWLVAAAGRFAGGVNEAVARFPSAIAAALLVLGVAVVASRHYGPGIGLLAGAVQATTAWTVLRGRLAEADVLLACLITWAIVAFDRMIADDDATARGMATVAVGVLRLAGADVAGQGDRLRRRADPGGRGGRDAVAPRRGGDAPADVPGRLDRGAVLSIAWPMAMVVRHGPVRWRSGRCTWPTAWPRIRPRLPASPGGSTPRGC